MVPVEYNLYDMADGVEGDARRISMAKPQKKRIQETSDAPASQDVTAASALLRDTGSLLAAIQ